MTDINQKPDKTSAGIYLLPNLFTTASLFCGFYAILSAIDKNFLLAAILIFIAMIFDGCDGRIARLTNTCSEFGVQYDSLADLVSFGVAPAILLYQWTLYLIANEPLIPSKFGWLAAFVYCACAALRLARFNTNVEITDKAYFVGLPSPSAGGLIAGFVWFSEHFGFMPKNLSLISAFLLIICGFLMICNLPYFSGKSLKINSKLPFVYAVIPAIVLGIVFLKPALMLFLLFSAYVIHAPILCLWRKFSRRSS
ncbi:MAG: CDP-diacylglycerol--serine O-phosphatidyltransferase [Cardiobacteriaceae bacterium]|nr:CDP-diacylglycerol--serine O-phosphatidyltransferase [Cardiobacteriaceae bacterium]